MAVAPHSGEMRVVHSVERLVDLPVEIHLYVFAHLDVESIFRLSRTSRIFRRILETKKAAILLPVLRHEFSPFDELLQAYCATVKDLDTAGPVCLPKHIVFQRQFDNTGVVLARGDKALPRRRPDATSNDEFVRALRGRAVVPGSIAAEPRPSLVTLRDSDLGSVIRWCRLVRKWEDAFPSLRWIERPQDCRLLRPHEKARLRRALYRWWLYAVLFHGDSPRPRPGVPEPYVDDLRIGQLRTYSTSELFEIFDFHVTVEDMIRHYFFPTLLKFQVMDQFAAAGNYADEVWDRVDPSVRARVLKTYAKLDPQSLIYYFENLYSYSPKSLVTDILVRHPGFASDQASIMAAIGAVMDERSANGACRLMATDNGGGILDFDDDRELLRSRCNADASPDGLPSRNIKFTLPRSHHTPAGDDGSTMEDSVHEFRWTPGRVSSRLVGNQMALMHVVPSWHAVQQA